MNPTAESTLMNRLCAAIAAARFLTMSIVVHIVIVVLGGTAVLFKAYQQAPDFVASAAEEFLTETQTANAPPNETIAPPSVTTEAPPVSVTTSVPMDALQTTAPSSYSVAPPLAMNGTALDRITERINSLGKAGGGGGAGGKMGGTGMQMFGVQASATTAVICLDVSSSMISGAKSVKTYEVLEQEVVNLVKSLKDQARFGIVVFSRDAKPYRRVLLRASNEEKQRAINWLRKLSPEQVNDPNATEEEREFHHGTRADRGLALAFEMQPDVIFFISDGQPSGSTPSEILAQVQSAQKNLPQPATIHAFAYLADGGQQFMAELAQQNLGTFREINPSDVK